MKIKIAKIIRPLNLADYAEEYGDAAVDVWLNPPSEVTDEISRAIREISAAYDLLKDLRSGDAKADELRATIEAQSEKMAGLFSRIWSQGKDPNNHISLEDIKSLVEEGSQNGDPLYAWMKNESWRMVLEHRAGIKKK